MGTQTNFDCIVVGLGGVGSAALYHAVQLGWKVLGIDQFPLVHDRGSSHGQTRIIRQAYFEHPGYVPLARQAYARWDELQLRWGNQLRFQTGLLQVGPTGGEVIQGLLQCAELHSMDVEYLSGKQARQRFPMFAVPADRAAVFEAVAGYLRVEDCVRAHLELALSDGAQVRVDQPVVRWVATTDSVRVQTVRATYSAGCLILAAGPWSASLLDSLQIRLDVIRKPQHWFQTKDQRLALHAGCPAFLFETPDGVFYGFPAIDDAGVKIAQHSGGCLVADPLTVNRELDRDELAQVQRFVDQYLPDAGASHLRQSVCLYTRSADEHFFVDTHPDHGNVALAAGLSGHGFKFAPVLGEYLVGLLRGGRREEMEFLRLDRWKC